MNRVMLIFVFLMSVTTVLPSQNSQLIIIKRLQVKSYDDSPA